MAVSSKEYPKALPRYTPDELAVQSTRLGQWDEELAAQSKRLSQWNKDLAERAARLRRWAIRLVGAGAVLLLVTAAAALYVKHQVGAALPAAPAVVSPQIAQSNQAKLGDIGQAKEARDFDPPAPAAKASSHLPMGAFAKPDAALASARAASIQQAGFLEALGGLSAAHLYQSHLNLGLLADGVESETYTIEEAQKNLKSVVELMTQVDGQLAKITKTGLDAADQASIKEIQAIAALLHLQADSLKAYWASGERDEAEQFQRARKTTWVGLSDVLGF